MRGGLPNIDSNFQVSLRVIYVPTRWWPKDMSKSKRLEKGNRLNVEFKKRLLLLASSPRQTTIIRTSLVVICYLHDRTMVYFTLARDGLEIMRCRKLKRRLTRAKRGCALICKKWGNLRCITGSQNSMVETKVAIPEVHKQHWWAK